MDCEDPSQLLYSGVKWKKQNFGIVTLEQLHSELFFSLTRDTRMCRVGMFRMRHVRRSVPPSSRCAVRSAPPASRYANCPPVLAQQSVCANCPPVLA